MRTAFDMSSVMWTCLQARRDPEAYEVVYEDRKVLVNTAAYGYENAVNLIVSALQDTGATPNDMLMVFEGQESKKRRMAVAPFYKSGRDSRPPEAYVEFNKLKAQLSDTFRSLGAIALQQDFVEGDDVLAWLADNVEEPLMIVTNDNDLITLNKTNEYGAKVEVRVNGVVGENKYGPFPFHLVTLYKTLVGDSSDSVPGVPSFGAKSFEAFAAKYGNDGMEELLEAIAGRKLDDLQDLDTCPLMAKVLAHKQEAYTAHRLVSLHPEWVNTMQTQIVWSPGMTRGDVTDERLRRWRSQARLVTAGTFEAALAFFRSKMVESPDVTFDIETSVPDESLDWSAESGVKVDVLASELTGFSLTFGANRQYTYYVSVDHRDTDNVCLEQARVMIESVPAHLNLVIQNTSFEGVVLYQTRDGGMTWGERWKDNGFGGFLPNWLDTKFEGSYVDENQKLGLKDRSLLHLGYQQTSYVDTVSKVGKREELPHGGQVTAEHADGTVTVQYQMNELAAEEVFDYGTDDTICTAALHNFYKLRMQLEHHWKVYLQVEIDASYLHAKNFVDGTAFSLERMRELEAEDKVTYDAAWAAVRKYLIENGWAGTVPPTYSAALTAAQIKEAFSIVVGMSADEDDENADVEAATSETPEGNFLKTRVRTPSKLVDLARSLGFESFADMTQACLDGKHEMYTAWVRKHFTGEPAFAISNKQMGKLLYDVMGLPVRVRRKATVTMRAKGIMVGTPSTDALAIEYAFRDASEAQALVLQNLKLMQMVKTRQGLYYKPYPYFLHWRDGRIHGSHNQCQTNTRRASMSGPNSSQLPKHPKIEGQPAKFRETIVPHKDGAVVVSLDFDSQELRFIAEDSGDPNMRACYVGEALQSMHSMTGLGIAKTQDASMTLWTLETFEAVLADSTHPKHKDVKLYRSMGKKCNFTSEYGAQAPKLAAAMLVSEDEAQKFLDAREAAFPGVVSWKASLVDSAKRSGVMRTMLGAVRHLREAFLSRDAYERSKAERQAVNFRVQSSCAEMTKQAEGRVWKSGVLNRLDAVCYGPIHDELVFSVVLDDLLALIQGVHACMVAPYGRMDTVPILSSISFGPSFGTQFEIGTEPTEEAVAKGLQMLKDWRVKREQKTAAA